MAFSLCSCAKKSVVYINCSTGPATGALYPLGLDVCSLWSSKINYIEAEAQVTAGGLNNLELLSSGDAHVCMAITKNCYESYNGAESFNGRPNKNLRVIAGLYLNPNNLLVNNDSNINSIGDLKDKSISVGPKGSSTEGEAICHIEAAGLIYPDDIDAQYTTFTDAVSSMKLKTLDGAWIMAGLGNVAVTEALENADAKILDIDSDIIKKLLAEYPWYAEYTIPAGEYPNQTEDVHTTAIKLLMVTTSELNDDIVYELTKTFWKNVSSLAVNNPSLAGVTVNDAVSNIANLPIHSGAERYYREIGVLN